MLKSLAFGIGFAAVFAGAALAADAGYVPTRTILQQTDQPGSNYTVVMAVTEIAAGMTAARHTHPGVEISYLLEGECDFIIEGIGKKHIKAGESFRLESGVKHSVVNGPGTTKVLAVYIIPKGAALATPAPE
jgi:quercetin dioxygenase-like cupin family protein